MQKQRFIEYIDKYAGAEYAYQNVYLNKMKITVVFRILGKSKITKIRVIGTYYTIRLAECEIIDFISHHNVGCKIDASPVLIVDNDVASTIMYKMYNVGDIVGNNRYVLAHIDHKKYLEYILSES